MKWFIALLLVVAASSYCRGYPLDCRLDRFDYLPDDAVLDEAIGHNVTVTSDCMVPYLLFDWSSEGGENDQFQPLYNCTWNSTQITTELDVVTLPVMLTARTIQNLSVQLPFGSVCTFGGCYHNGNFRIYHVEPVTCTIDVDECAEGADDCDSNANCIDTIESFNCTCQLGYRGNGTYCQDVDECNEGLHNCSENAHCNNTEGGFDCHCKTGFIGDNCTNTNECRTVDKPCGLDELLTCQDTEGSFLCVCYEGYERTSTGECENINECIEGHHDCHRNADCTDVKGSYSCTCKTGFEGDGHNCDIGPLIGVLGIGIPAVIILVLCAIILAATWTVIKKRQSKPSLEYMEYFFPWKEPLDPDYALIDVERRVSDTPSVHSVFDKLIKPDKRTETAHSSTEGDSTDIVSLSSVNLPMLPTGTGTTQAVGEAAVHNALKTDDSSTTFVISHAASPVNGPMARPVSHPGSACSPGGYVTEKPETHASPVDFNLQPQEDFGEEAEEEVFPVMPMADTSADLQQFDVVKDSRSGYNTVAVREVVGVKGGGYVSETSLRSPCEEGSDQIEMGTLDVDSVQMEEIPLSDLIAPRSTGDGGYIDDGEIRLSHQCSGGGYLSSTADFESQASQGGVADHSSRHSPSSNPEVLDQDGNSNDPDYSIPISGPIQPPSWHDSSGHHPQLSTTDSGYVCSSFLSNSSTENWADLNRDALSIHLEDEQEEEDVFEVEGEFFSATYLPKTGSGYVENANATQSSLVPFCPTAPEQPDNRYNQITGEEMNGYTRGGQATSILHTATPRIEGGYVENITISDHLTSFSMVSDGCNWQLESDELSIDTPVDHQVTVTMSGYY